MPNSLSLSQLIIDWLSTDYWLTIDHVSTNMAVDISVDTTHSKHDLKFVAGLLQGCRMTMIQPNAKQ